MLAATLLLAVLVAACGRGGQVLDAGPAPTRPAVQPSASAAAVPAPAPSEPHATTTPRAGGGDDGAGGGGGAEPPAAATTSVTVYFTRGERVAPVSRTVTRVPRIGSAALEQLLAGPTAAEAAAGYRTQIPDGTRLRGLTVADGLAVVDLSGEFEAAGGTLAMTLRLAQVACTLDVFPTVDGVRFAVDGEVVEVFSGDGLIVDEPVTCRDYTEPASAADGVAPPTAQPS